MVNYNKPSYVSFNQSNGIIIFNANSIKPESQVTIISRAGSGNTESSSTNTVAAPPLHTVVINEIIKEQGQNVSNEDVNNAVQVANKRNAVIKRCNTSHSPCRRKYNSNTCNH